MPTHLERNLTNQSFVRPWKIIIFTCILFHIRHSRFTCAPSSDPLGNTCPPPECRHSAVGAAAARAVRRVGPGVRGGARAGGDGRGAGRGGGGRLPLVDGVAPHSHAAPAREAHAALRTYADLRLKRWTSGLARSRRHTLRGPRTGTEPSHAALGAHLRQSGRRFYLEHSPAFLDAPGEWVRQERSGDDRAAEEAR